MNGFCITLIPTVSLNNFYTVNHTKLLPYKIVFYLFISMIFVFILSKHTKGLVKLQILDYFLCSSNFQIRFSATPEAFCRKYLSTKSVIPLSTACLFGHTKRALKHSCCFNYMVIFMFN